MKKYKPGWFELLGLLTPIIGAKALFPATAQRQDSEPIKPLPLKVALDQKNVLLGARLFGDVRRSKKTMFHAFLAMISRLRAALTRVRAPLALTVPRGRSIRLRC
jgi:hypothetical protein